MKVKFEFKYKYRPSGDKGKEVERITYTTTETAYYRIMNCFMQYPNKYTLVDIIPIR